MAMVEQRISGQRGLFGKYAYAWLTAGFFLVSLALHWWLGWRAFAADAHEHAQLPLVADYLDEMMRDTFENWQSEFLQLLWQVVGLAYFLYVGSPSSKENDDRMEAKMDALLRLQGGSRGEQLIAAIDRDFMRTGGHAIPHGHGNNGSGGGTGKFYPRFCEKRPFLEASGRNTPINTPAMLPFRRMVWKIRRNEIPPSINRHRSSIAKRFSGFGGR